MNKNNQNSIGPCTPKIYAIVSKYYCAAGEKHKNNCEIVQYYLVWTVI